MSENLPKPSSLKPGDHLYLIDGSGFIFRAYHALPPLTRKTDGLPVGAVQGFCNMLWKLLSEMKSGEKPTHLAVIFDESSKTFRNTIYPAYKANRTEPPADLRPQFSLIRQATRAFNVACVELANYEADDLIATYARQAVEAKATCRIVSSDKDLMQLVRPGVTLFDTMKDKDLGEEAVFEKFGVTPDKVIDVQSLAGDSIDNVPGVPGIGLKTGAQLIAEYGDLENLLQRASEIKQQKRRENLIAFADQARLSKRLVTLDDNVPVAQQIDSFAIDEPKASQLVGFLKALEFSTITRKIASEIGADMGAIDPVPVEIKFWPPEGGIEALPENQKRRFTPRTTDPQSDTLSADVVKMDVTVPFVTDRYEIVSTADALRKIVARIYETYKVTMNVLATSDDAMRARIAGIGFAFAPNAACYVPLEHAAKGDGLFGGDRLEGQLSTREALDILRPMFEDASVLKIGYDVKTGVEILARHAVHLVALEDVQLLSYAFESGLTSHSLAALAERHLSHQLTPLKGVTGSGRTALAFDRLPLANAAHYACEVVDSTSRLAHLLRQKLLQARKVTVYESLERPLVPVLAQMESAGVLIDTHLLRKLSNEFAQTSAALEKQIHSLAGESFNIGSPKQLGDILFGKLGIQGGRKTATGAWSTDADTLEELASTGLELAQKVLDWRQIFKLMSNYTDALPTYINPETGRVHTSYMMASTSTGRLSSTEPNLQNIPIRTEEGKKIRAAFLAAPGNKLISADYGQIELRVFAHVANIPELKEAFARGDDIHAMTASEMFGIPVLGMDPAVRRRAKAINFGIIYGISAFGLANQLGISREEAGSYIKTYFSRFPGIRAYMDAMRQQIHELGYVETLFGRRCHFPKVKSPNPSERSNAERAAINAPIQGSAADIIRRAMIRMMPALAEQGLMARMLLQVHDELIFECPAAEAAATCEIVKKIMVNAPEPVVKLTVPLAVDARAADSWDEAH